jgi:stage II sporulation protein P
MKETSSLIGQGSYRLLVRMYVLLTAVTTLLFVLLGLGGVFQSALDFEQAAPMRQLAARLGKEMFVHLLSRELPAVRHEPLAVSRSSLAVFSFQWLTGLNPFEPRSLLAGALPAMSPDDGVLLHSGRLLRADDRPFETVPPEPPSNRSPTSPQPSQTSQTSVQSGKRHSIFIYHSHNRESWVPELKKKGRSDAEDAFDETLNVTLLGKRLATRLQTSGVDALAAADDYPDAVPAFKYTNSYTYSLKTVRNAITTNRAPFDFYFDLHRDSQGRKKTTILKDGVAYAQVYFIVGGKNPNWRKNYEFAKSIHDKLEARFPGLSKSIYAKHSGGNGEYNQSVSPHSALIEIGGPYNTLEESYRTIDVLADVIAQLYGEAQAVRAQTEGE